MFLGQKLPKSEASQKGLKLGEMFKDVGILGALVVCFLLALFFSGPFGVCRKRLLTGYPAVLLLVVAVITRFSLGALLLFVLFITHALVGAVELGTDGWIQNITGNILTSGQGKLSLRLHLDADVPACASAPISSRSAWAFRRSASC